MHQAIVVVILLLTKISSFDCMGKHIREICTLRANQTLFYFLKDFESKYYYQFIKNHPKLPTELIKEETITA